MKYTRLVLSLIAVAFISFLVYRRTHPGQAPEFSGNGDMVLQVHSISVTNNLALDDFSIPAKGMHDVRIAANEERMRNPRLTGYFSTGTGPGIKVMLLDEDQYNRLRNNQTPSEYA